jgi:hypothetical protein
MGHVDLNNPDWRCINCRHTAYHHRKICGAMGQVKYIYCNETLGMTAGTGSGGTDVKCGCGEFAPESNFNYLKRTQREQRITV